MRSVVEIGASVPAFLGKLWKLVNDSETNHLISWSPGGKTFVIKNQADFARELLPLYYKHNNMASFIRQLNMYGFHKITSVENGGLRYEKDEIEFSHPCFMRGHAYLLEHIKRKIANPKSIVASSEGGEKIIFKPELMNKVLADVKQMKGKQESLDAKFSAMKQENEALWREVAILRQKHIKQQQIVNNLIQFLMSLVQPARAPAASGNNVGVKRPYQLMINSAAHNANDAYPGTIKNIKLDKENLLEEINEDNLEDGPTIHELAHDDILNNDTSQDSLDATGFVTVNLSSVPIINSGNSDGTTLPTQYHVTMEDDEDTETDGIRLRYPNNCTNGMLRSPNTQPIVTSPSPTISSASPMEQIFVTVPSTSKPKTKTCKKNVSNTKNINNITLNNYNTINPTADFKLPAEIFASDDSISDAGAGGTDDINNFNELNGNDLVMSTSKDKMLGGINIKVESADPVPSSTEKKAKKSKDNTNNFNLADIKTELQDDFDWNNMTLATVHNNPNLNKLQTMCRRDNINQNREDYSLFASNSNKNDIDDHLDSMQTDLESLRELLRSDSYSFDTNTLLGTPDTSLQTTLSFNPSLHQHIQNGHLFGSDDPFYGLSYNADERAKATNAKKMKGEISNVTCDETRVQSPFNEDDAEGNQLISYTGNIPDFEDISIPDLDADNNSMPPSPSRSTLNTPQIELRSPSFVLKH
ncbi:heat shock factor protein isoform X2 [Pieris brassicae]|uniref:heat shock factor protein isoform X2 n=1 Tax=Pieris brassicae TaxID=7116 RepID=UPI001E66257F|nr:heat shock factor protein isoform X2 [Pieris brassicae]